MEVQFYGPATSASFTLLGLWWVVAQFKFGEWSRSRAGRRLVYDTSLYFMIPAFLGLVSLSAPTSTAVWRTAFAIASVAVGLNSLRASVRSQERKQYPYFVAYVAPRLATVVYALIVVVALLPRPTHDVLGLTGLETEAILLTIVLVIGVNVAWFVLSHDSQQAEPRR